ncbi:MAG: cyclase family protein [Chloroflexota bacterium]|nr:cyclase family protein [Chloroflexota bacterium]
MNRRRVLGAAGMAAAAGAIAPFASHAQDATPVTGASTPVAVDRSISISSIVDLTHTLSPTFPVFAGKPQFAMETIVTFAEDGFYGNILTFDEHSGTHMDAPAHFSAEGAATADELPIENFFVPLIVIDISAKAASDDDAALTADDIAAWESDNGEIPAGSFVAMYSGWESRIEDPEAFINLDAQGVQHFPGIAPDAATFLVEERDIVGAGVDTVSLDIGASTDFQSHYILLGAGLYGLEGLANLGTLPPEGTTIIVGRPKHERASGGPSRVYAVF